MVSFVSERSTRIYFVRHGQVDSYWRPRIYGDLNVPLSEHGRREALHAAERLAEVSLSAVISSDLDRAVYGAAIVAEGRDVVPEVDPGLREMNRGAWAGLTFEELEESEPGAWAAWHAAPRTSRPPGGESLAELAERIFARLDHWAARFAGAEIAIVSHSWPIRISSARALGLELEQSLSLKLSTGEIAVVDWPTAAGERPGLAAFALDDLPQGRSWFQGPG